MPITNLIWDPDQGCDIHVLRNNQAYRRLDEIIYVVEVDDINTKKTFISGRVFNLRSNFESMVFRPIWYKANNVVETTSSYEFNAIRVKKVSGEITAQSQVAPRITSFVIEVGFEVASGGGAPPQSLTLFARSWFTFMIKLPMRGYQRRKHFMHDSRVGDPKRVRQLFTV